MSHLKLVGCDHSLVPPTQLRRLAERGDDLLAALQAERRRGTIAGAVLLSTCNRIEIVYDLVADEDPVPALIGSDLPLRRLDGAATVHHWLRVATGLESAVLGEEQILGQFARAFRTAGEAALLSKRLYRLWSRVLGTARETRQSAGLSSERISMAALAAKQLARCGRRFAVIGAGETGRLALEHLARREDRELWIVNRTLHKAETLARQLGARAIALDEFLADPPELDGVLIAIGSNEPVISARHAARWRTIVDLSQPCVLGPDVTRDGSRVFDLDDIGTMAAEHARSQRQRADLAAAMIAERVDTVWGELADTRVNYGRVVDLHVESAMAEFDSALRALRHLDEGDLERVRSLLLRSAKRHAHFHIQDLRRGAPVAST